MSRLPAFLSNKLALACRTALALSLLSCAAVSAQPAAPSPVAPGAEPEARPGPGGEHGREGRAPRMSLQAAASSEVMQDTVRISLSAEVEAPDQPTAGQRLTAALEDAVKRAKGNEGIDVRTGGFNVWPNTDNKGKVTGWRGQGEIVLQSKDFAKASALASKLSDKTAISNIGFLLSREAREAEERKLLTQAAQAFRERAVAAANAFGFSGYRIMRIELGGTGGPQPMARAPAPMMMAKAGDARAADVPLEAGEVTVTVSVSGTISLQ
ncbi:Predicted periplasmic/secreted protein [Bordetella ansorpii]|jgi:predicted secreted protein|uniref:Predicted periplasmic/secreted protein n=1 Tax=Bordetella ansorpii TaxID=288768 RepID=A0A157QIP6_9BORD|nr:SIMPL domain-containing protein [Bordetella ansorpii]SAI45410.1 Predicted periplasmic/secreted protein [Bordetella ansorpii]